MDSKVKEALEALASGNASLFACLWNSYREKNFAYHGSKTIEPDPFAPIYEEARRILNDCQLTPGGPNTGKPFMSIGLELFTCSVCGKDDMDRETYLSHIMNCRESE